MHRLIGFFVNMLPLKNHLEEEQTFADFLNRVKKTSVKAYENQDYQFEELVGQLPLAREAGRHPLIDTVFALRSLEEDPEYIPAALRGTLKITPYERVSRSTHFDLMLHATAGSDSLTLVFEYSTALFKPSTIETLARNYTRLLEQVINKPNPRVKELAVHHDFIATDPDFLLKQETGFDF